MILDDALALVREFHLRMGVPQRDHPTPLTCEPHRIPAWAATLRDLSTRAFLAGNRSQSELLLRLGMTLEELAEWTEAHAQGDLAAAGDAWADRAYLLFGDAVATGLPVSDLFTEIHRSNMTKDAASDESGKGIKGPSYHPPDVASIIAAAQLGE